MNNFKVPNTILEYSQKEYITVINKLMKIKININIFFFKKTPNSIKISAKKFPKPGIPMFAKVDIKKKNVNKGMVVHNPPNSKICLV